MAVEYLLEPELEDDERVVARVFCYRVMDEDGGMRTEVLTDDGEGGDNDVAAAQLAVAQHVLVCERDDDDDED
jgi:hypothetical protein